MSDLSHLSDARSQWPVFLCTTEHGEALVDAIGKGDAWELG